MTKVFFFVFLGLLMLVPLLSCMMAWELLFMACTMILLMLFLKLFFLMWLLAFLFLVIMFLLLILLEIEKNNQQMWCQYWFYVLKEKQCCARSKFGDGWIWIWHWFLILGTCLRRSSWNIKTTWMPSSLVICLWPSNWTLVLATSCIIALLVLHMLLIQILFIA